MENNIQKMDAEDILRQSLNELTNYVSATFEMRMELESLSTKMNDLLIVSERRNTLSMGLFDVEVNPYVTINVLALINLLADELNQILTENQPNPLLAVTLSVAVFITSLLNLIQPELPVKLSMTDAKVYCELLHMQEYRPINDPVPQEKVEECIRQMDEAADICACLKRLEKKKLICQTKNGWLVIRKVKVKRI